MLPLCSNEWQNKNKNEMGQQVKSYEYYKDIGRGEDKTHTQKKRLQDGWMWMHSLMM